MSERERLGRGKALIAGGVTAALLGAGGILGVRALEQSQGQANPRPTNSPAATGVQPAPDTSPTVEPTKSPEIKIKPTGDILWDHKKAPLGLLTQPEYHEQDGSTDVIATGIIMGIEEKKVVIEKKEETVYLLSVDFGRYDTEKDIIANLIIGATDDIVVLHYLFDRYLDVDPNPAPINGDLYQNVVPVKEFIPDIKIGGQYAFRIIINQNPNTIPANCDQIPGCQRWQSLTKFLPHNKKLVDLLSGKQTQQPGLGYLNEFFIPETLRT